MVIAKISSAWQIRIFFRPIRWLVFDWFELTGAGLLWEKNIIDWLIWTSWNQQTNRQSKAKGGQFLLAKILAWLPGHTIHELVKIAEVINYQQRVAIEETWVQLSKGLFGSNTKV